MNDHADPVIAVRGLVKRFGPVTAVAGVDVDVQTGEVFGFLGPNGAGKTTTVRMLTGVLEPSDGTASIQDHDIRTEALLSRAHLGVVPEEANVYLDLSVWRNLMLMAELHGVPRRQRITESEQLLEALGLADRKLHKARTLSKGLRQRLMLCAALVTGPEILFLDEPTSGLDVASVRLVGGLCYQGFQLCLYALELPASYAPITHKDQLICLDLKGPCSNVEIPPCVQ